MANSFVEKICGAIRNEFNLRNYSTLDRITLDLLKDNANCPLEYYSMIIDRNQDHSIIELCISHDLVLSLKFILDRGFSPNFIGCYSIGSKDFIINYCMRRHASKCAKLLISYGANINKKGRIGTSLHCAAYWSCYKLLRYLILKGGDVYSRNSAGQTVIDLINDAGEKNNILDLVEELTLIKPNIKIKLKVL